MTYARAAYNTWEEYMDAKYGNRIKERCKNFIFFEDGSMKYDFNKFNSYIDAMIDAVQNGEDIDTVVSLVFREKIDQPIVKEKLLKIINNK
jgi:hypothetical protein